MKPLLIRTSPDDLVAPAREPFDGQTLADARAIVDGVREGGESTLRAQADRADAPLVFDADALEAGLQRLPSEVRAVLERTARRIESFARDQRAAFGPLDATIAGGRGGHRLLPVGTAGCYVESAGTPRPSAVLMTVIPARVARVGRVWVACDDVSDLTLAAAALAGADGLLALGGPGAIAALATGVRLADGVELPRCDLVVGAGGPLVSAAKYIVSTTTAIDSLTGVRELVLVADRSADPVLVASDLLAHGDGGIDAAVTLVTHDAEFIDAVERALAIQLDELPVSDPAASAVRLQGRAVLVGRLDAAVAVCDMLAPEHLCLHGQAAEDLATDFTAFGAMSLGATSPRALIDHGAGPNPVLPTGGAARYASGLSVLTFMRVATWLRMHPGRGLDEVVGDAAALARIEGREGHVRALERRAVGDAAHDGPRPQLQPEARPERARTTTAVADS